MKLTNDDTIKALECCSHSDCSNCPFDKRGVDCDIELPKKALRVINHYRDKNEQLKNNLKVERETSRSRAAEVTKLTVKIKSLYKEMVRIAKWTVPTDHCEKGDW